MQSLCQVIARLFEIPLVWAARKLSCNTFHQIQCGQVHFISKSRPENTVVIGRSKPTTVIYIHDEWFWVRLLTSGSLGLAESYMLGEIDCADLRSILKIGLLNRDQLNQFDTRLSLLGTLFNRFKTVNTVDQAKLNVAAHYDTSNAMFAAFLDEGMSYSCPVWLPTQHHNHDHSHDTLEKAQQRKNVYHIQSAQIQASDHVLEIGVGWGTFAMQAVRETGCRVTAITLSNEQKILAEQRIAAAGLSKKITILLCDYREILDQGVLYDKVVSIEMVEHVGEKYWQEYFRGIHRSLKPNRIASFQSSIISNTVRGCESQWLEHLADHMGGCNAVQERKPGECQMADAITYGTHDGLVLDQVEDIAGFNRALRQWSDNFDANFDSEIRPDLMKKIPKITPALIEAFKRNWLPRCRAKEGPAFVFVDADGPEDQGVRVAIRRQAARSGRRRQHDSRISSQDETQDESSETTKAAAAAEVPSHQDEDETHITNNTISISYPQLSYNGYETLRIRYNFDITDLTSFTDVDLGKTAFLSLQGQPARLAGLLQKQPSSFLAYLPSRYGWSVCLDDAIHCVVARAGQMLGFPIAGARASALYGRALASLRAACEDEEHRMQADVYCATRLLALYELVELRGPKNHSSRFDWMLLKSQGPSIVVDEMYRHQKSIFETLSWQSFFQHASDTEYDPDASLWWKFFGAISFMPGVLKDMRILLSNTSQQEQQQQQQPQSSYTETRSAILSRAKQILTSLHHSHVLYQHTPPHPPSLFSLPTAPESPDRVRLRGFLLYVTMYICRVEATLSPGGIERAVAEAEAQTFASQALLIERTTVQVDPAMTWHLAQRNALALSIVQTRGEWYSDTERGWGEDGELWGFLGGRWLRWEDSWRDEYLKEELGG
ncbi:hypothetical protein FE257_003679 [Aspergillus nanangensis]|uniref:Cyclopropane-fatty-acyl-phospholipid synthase n=1 Tax=Aspergillus nanangensis TaxID=2582783 RepID=A0AAD4CSI6_ASPNN|nr:hypothetical protein FE257_003679 [Aspergillus nanangensis]